MSYRKSAQPLLPKNHAPRPAGEYDIYPAYPLPAGQIARGFEALADRLAGQRRIVIDGYVGTLWDHLREGLDQAFYQRDIEARWVSVDDALRPPEEIDALIEPYLGGDDPIFGTRFTGTLANLNAEWLKHTTTGSTSYFARSAVMRLDRYLGVVDPATFDGTYLSNNYFRLHLSPSGAITELYDSIAGRQLVARR